ncbi:MAG: hypothetical protein A2805_03410 [Candidatus Andersenbacteria bacterium RIFCSPHIGHO2_01_FULL_46_36]|uniref:G8 domain-containing protein n=1 Tax=Candidatus Andersenbacteria bacterium RIFCSPHIGHO2_12_FULL_45_11 TaxID=1797281 RepID=A0A1G1X2J1_9BACT|nr:MAG: hypothetical protein A2805_03410 [Candidatus Andersenbacteria bacterium RIFCSPHIGHO2_01_FULL_46_36]OGY34219.1 MAG: hypothetical protein A3D99_03720 [Candidatus Andersenbacteria bacterium RIFCSPHIGHO2_12_FULL_45_11]
MLQRVIVTSAFFIAAIAVFVFPHAADAASRYWVGSVGGNFNDGANWAAADPASCTGGGASVPGTADIAIFDADCDNDATMDATISVAGININTGYTGSISPSSAISITVGSSGFVQASGTFTSTAGTMAISGPFNRTGGTFTHNSGTVKFLMNGSNFTFTPGTSLTLYNVTIDKTTDDSDPILTFGASFTIANDVTVQASNSDGSYGYSVYGSGSPTITVQGDINFPSTAATGQIYSFGSTAGSAFSINLAGDITLSDSNLTASYLNITFDGTGNQIITHSAGTISGGTLTVNRPSETAGTAVKLGANFSSRPFTVTAGTLSLEGYNLTSAASSVASGATFQLQGGETVTNAPTLSSGSTVKYNGTSTYTVKDWGYHHLAFDGSGGVFTLGAAESIAGNLTLTNGTFDISGFNLTVTGTFSNAATLRLQGGETTFSVTMDTDSGTVEYDGTSSYTGLKAGNTYYNLTLNGSGGTWTQNATLDVNGALTITAGTLASSANAITLAGNWSNSGTFTHGNNTVTLDGTSQAITGSANTTFYNLTKTVSSADTLTFNNARTATIANNAIFGC